MNLQLPRRLLVVALLAVGAVSSAQAVNYVEIDGANVKFYYDSDFWGLNTATVTGNSISFAPSNDFAVFAKSSTVSGIGSGGHADFSSLNVFAVAKTGYSVASQVTGSATSSYSFSTGSGTSYSELGAYIYSGVYSSGDFGAEHYEDQFFTEASVFSTGTASSGTKVISETGGSASSYFSAVGLDSGAGISAYQVGKGRTDSVLTEVKYDFSVSAVPEPETYAMMIAGLGLVGFAARRRKTAA